MFTGLVQQQGTVIAMTPGETFGVTVRPDAPWDAYLHGESIAVSGVCLTVVSWSGQDFIVDVMQQTLDLTSLAGLRAGKRVNLERALRVGDRLGGHIVQGHVDGVGEVVQRGHAERYEVVGVRIPAALRRYVVDQGSICLDGVSLTVSAGPDVDGVAEVSLIPETLMATTLGLLGVGDPVNVEVDVLAKYVESLLGGRR